MLSRLAEARAKLEARDLPGAVAIYEEVLATAGDRADVLVTVSGDLGTNGHIQQIVELIAPRYDAQRHGPATGLNLLQAYLAARQPESAQHVLDILFSLNRPELEERLFGFSNAIADMMAQAGPVLPTVSDAPGSPAQTAGGPPKVGLITISKPIWFYGLESLATQILPPKEGRLRRVAFAQLALPGFPQLAEAMQKPEEELGRLSRGFPLWLAETFYFSPHYSPVAAIGMLENPAGAKSHVLFGAEWTSDNLRQLVDTTEGGLDYVFTGALHQRSGDYELVLRVWEVKKFRERKTFTARWTPATATTELLKLHESIRLFMEWTPETRGLPYAPPAEPLPWIETLGSALSLFLVGKSVLPKEQLAPVAPVFDQLAPHAVSTPSASLAWLTLLACARYLGVAPNLAGVQLSSHPVVAEARQVIG